MKLRWAEDTDRDFFYEVRNDAQSIRFSYSKKPLDYAAHAQWWRETQDNLFVAEIVRLNDYPSDPFEALAYDLYAEKNYEAHAVGTVRLTALDDACCEIHFALHPDHRGKGYAVGMLREGRKMAGECGFSHIIARVDSPNTASLRAFLREGYSVTSPGTMLLERDI